MEEEIEILYKENHWLKNKIAHAMMRERIKANTMFCVHCKNRLCATPEPVYGTKALKKCKWNSQQKIKLYILKGL
jgi:hypothetical protein